MGLQVIWVTLLIAAAALVSASFVGVRLVRRANRRLAGLEQRVERLEAVQYAKDLLRRGEEEGYLSRETVVKLLRYVERLSKEELA